MRIGICAPSCQLDPALPDRLRGLAADALGADAPEFVFHDQCHLNAGHFAGDDAARLAAFVEMANDPTLDAIWFARGGYGANRIAAEAIKLLGAAAHAKSYLGYSDAGFLLAALYRHGIGRVAHGPMPADLKRAGGEAAVLRGLRWLLDPEGAEQFRPSGTGTGLNLNPPLTGTRHKVAAFNLTVFSALLGTSLEPDLTDHILILEDVDEYMYRLDRTLFHVTSCAGVRQVAGILLGRVEPVPPNEPDFGADEEAIIQHWCTKAGITYLGRADIGHDANNKVVAFG
jgi:muramoyltetrapeptide carboxypeptidase